MSTCWNWTSLGKSGAYSGIDAWPQKRPGIAISCRMVHSRAPGEGRDAGSEAWDRAMWPDGAGRRVLAS
jgi:hypothetical protein